MGMYRILSIDGGGIRGVVAAKLLQQIEQEYLQGASLHDSFDMFVGTSTGAVIAAAIANKKSPTEILDLYKNKNDQIFSGLYCRILRHLDIAVTLRIRQLETWLAPELKFLVNPLRLGFSLLQTVLSFPTAIKPKYDTRNVALKEVMQTALGVKQPTFKKIRETQKKHLVITSYDTLQRQQYLFDSENPEFDDVPISEAAFCSSSAPIFFPAKEFATEAQRCLIDGGLVANNPVTIAIAKALEAGKRAKQRGEKSPKPCSIDEIQILSIGTGDPTRVVSFQEAKGWGLLQWANRLPDIFFDGASDTNHLVAQELLSPGNYLRLQFELNSDDFENINFLNDDMDDTRPQNIANLIEAAQQYFAKFKENYLDATHLTDQQIAQNTYPNAFKAEVSPAQADFFERLRKDSAEETSAVPAGDKPAVMEQSPTYSNNGVAAMN